jgi:hypothetical protein
MYIFFPATIHTMIYSNDKIATVGMCWISRAWKGPFAAPAQPPVIYEQNFVINKVMLAVLCIRIRPDPKLFAS